MKQTTQRLRSVALKASVPLWTLWVDHALACSGTGVLACRGFFPEQGLDPSPLERQDPHCCGKPSVGVQISVASASKRRGTDFCGFSSEASGSSMLWLLQPSVGVPIASNACVSQCRTTDVLEGLKV